VQEIQSKSLFILSLARLGAEARLIGKVAINKTFQIMMQEIKAGAVALMNEMNLVATTKSVRERKILQRATTRKEQDSGE
jgi:hypothetical protein